MKPFQNAIICMFILFVIFVSGCINNTSTLELGNGVIIKDYNIDFSNVYSGECVDISVLLKNTGSVDAKQVFAEMLGIEQDWYDGKSWGKGCKSEDGGPWTGWEKSANEPQCRWNPGQQSYSLSAPDPSRGVDGETTTCSWSYVAPEVPSHTSVTYTPTIRVFYQYETDVVKAVTLMSQDEMKSLVKQGKPLPIDTQTSTRSPIKIDVNTDTPLRIYTDKVEFPITISIENIGGGITCVGYSSWDNIKDCRTSQQSAEKSAWRKIRIELDADNIIHLSDDCREPLELSLYKGKSNKITCTATVYSSDLPSQRVKALINVHAYYNYIIDKEITITVHGSVS